MREIQQAYNKYEYWLSGIVPLPGRKKIFLRELFGEAELLYRARQDVLHKIPILTEREKEWLIKAQGKTEAELEEEMAYCMQKGIKLAVWQSDSYPKRLNDIYNPPYGLFYRGELPEGEKKAIGIVGARNCTCYGRAAAKQIGQELAASGIVVVSGMAAGVDGAAQWGALCSGGCTCGVLGCGVDVCYPASNRKLYEKLLEAGSLVSEYPPHTQPLARNFPQRNRIISGMSDGVLIVEAKEKSGSLITADFALEQGREVYALPGRVSDLSSRGTNKLIQQGAGVFLNTEDFLEEMHIFAKTEENSVEASSKKNKLSLENLDRLVYSCLGLTPRSLEELLTETGLGLGELIRALATLRELGVISETYKNYYIRSDVFMP